MPDLSPRSPDSPSPAFEQGTVALFVRRFLPYSQTFIYEEIRAHERYDVDVFCIERMNEDRFPYPRCLYPESGWGRAVYNNTGYWPPFDRILSEGNHDVIHAHFGTAAVYALPYVQRHRLPFAVTFHGIDVGDLYGPRRFLPLQWRYWMLSPRIFEAADVLLADSIELGELLISIGAPEEKIRVQRLGVDLSRFYRAKERPPRPRVTMLGRFTEKKGFIYALRACAEAAAHGLNFDIVLIGSGPLEPQFRQFIKDRGLDNRVRFAGAIPLDQVADELAQTDVLLAPSVVTRTHDRDSGLVVAKEASASQVPVIGTYHGGIPSIIDDGETGFLVPERNVDTLTDRLVTLLRDTDLRRSMGIAAREKMEQEFDVHGQTRKLERHYDSIR